VTIPDATLLTRSTYSDRACAPEETLARIAPLLPRFGITRLARVTGLDCIGIPVWNAIVPNARSIVVNQGKGLTDIDAKVSAAMEALERTIAGNPALTTRLCSGLDLTADGHAWHPLNELVAAGAADIEPDEAISWVAGTSLEDGKTIFVPKDAILLDRTIGNCRFWQSSDGLASGNTIDEARLHALLERIERDAFALWQMTLPERIEAIAPESFADPPIGALCAKIAAAGLALRLFEVTSDIGIPCIAALLGPGDVTAARHIRYVDVTHGCGAHPNPVRAAIRAITEAAQSRLTFISGARDDILPEVFERPLPPGTRALFAASVREVVVERPDLPDGAAALLAGVVGKLSHTSLGPAIAVELHEPGLAIAVSKVFVPALENPEGDRKHSFGPRALSRSMEVL
jgi:ribosomal protein S12 methylthiotransferase accessory factor